MRFLLLFLLLSLNSFAAEAAVKSEDNTLWFRNVGEWLSYRSTRSGLATEPTAKLLTNGSRYDATLGKRISFYSCGKSLTEGFVAGGDGGMLASLHHIRTTGTGVFGTESFDGFFGLFTGYTKDGYLAMFRWGHLSAHLVDNAPNFGSPVNYSHFWGEAILGKTWPNPALPANWNLHLQGSAGMNYQASPPTKNPRYQAGFDAGYSPWGFDRLAFLTSSDLQNAGVLGQATHFTAFAGMGFMGRPESTRRPIRAGVTHIWGSDERNQYYSRSDSFWGFEIQAEL